MSTGAERPSVTASHVDTAQPTATYYAKVKCQLVRIRDNNVVGHVYGSGAGSSESKAYNAAVRDANSQVPANHYKRHCYKNNFGGGGGRF